MNKSWRYILNAVCIYQIGIWLISAGDYVMGIGDTVIPNKDSVSLLSNIVIITFSILVIISNIYVLLDRKLYLNRNLVFNKWLNFIQIIHFSVLGVSYYLIIGFHLVIYYIYDQNQDISWATSFYKFTLEVAFIKSNLISVGISIIPLCAFFIFDRAVMRNDSAVL